jgi:fluoride ion exporter CrcB/FEX
LSQRAVEVAISVGDRRHQRDGIAAAGDSGPSGALSRPIQYVADRGGYQILGQLTNFQHRKFETVRLVEQGRRLLALSNAIGSVLASGAACAVGLALV